VEGGAASCGGPSVLNERPGTALSGVGGAGGAGGAAPAAASRRPLPLGTPRMFGSFGRLGAGPGLAAGGDAGVEGGGVFGEALCEPHNAAWSPAEKALFRAAARGEAAQRAAAQRSAEAAARAAAAKRAAAGPRAAAPAVEREIPRHLVTTREVPAGWQGGAEFTVLARLARARGMELEHSLARLVAPAAPRAAPPAVAAAEHPDQEWHPRALRPLPHVPRRMALHGAAAPQGEGRAAGAGGEAGLDTGGGEGGRRAGLVDAEAAATWAKLLQLYKRAEGGPGIRGWRGNLEFRPEALELARLLAALGLDAPGAALTPRDFVARLAGTAAPCRPESPAAAGAPRDGGGAPARDGGGAGAAQPPAPPTPPAAGAADAAEGSPRDGGGGARADGAAASGARDEAAAADAPPGCETGPAAAADAAGCDGLLPAGAPGGAAEPAWILRRVTIAQEEGGVAARAPDPPGQLGAAGTRGPARDAAAGGAAPPAGGAAPPATAGSTGSAGSAGSAGRQWLLRGAPDVAERQPSQSRAAELLPGLSLAARAAACRLEAVEGGGAGSRGAPDPARSARSVGVAVARLQGAAALREDALRRLCAGGAAPSPRLASREASPRGAGGTPGTPRQPFPPPSPRSPAWVFSPRALAADAPALRATAPSLAAPRGSPGHSPERFKRECLRFLAEREARAGFIPPPGEGKSTLLARTTRPSVCKPAAALRNGPVRGSKQWGSATSTPLGAQEGHRIGAGSELASTA
jgi:hypothetical protein